METLSSEPAPGRGGDRTPRVQSVDRAMLLLRAVADAAPEDSTAARLAEACGLNRATAWRLLQTLEAHAVVLRGAHEAAAGADEAGDAGTNDLLAGTIIRGGQMQTWFIGQHLDGVRD